MTATEKDTWAKVQTEFEKAGQQNWSQRKPQQRSRQYWRERY